MKDRRLKMILIPLVIAIWSYAVYKYLFYTEEANTPISQATGPRPPASNPNPDTAYTLIANYRDPFLDQPAKSVVQRVKPQSTAPKPAEFQTPSATKTAIVPIIDWNIARFNGLVQRAGSTESDGLLSITGRLYHVAQGDIVKGIEILAIFPDSIKLRFENETKTITKR